MLPKPEGRGEVGPPSRSGNAGAHTLRNEHISLTDGPKLSGPMCQSVKRHTHHVPPEATETHSLSVASHRLLPCTSLCSLHTPKPPRHTKSETLFLCPSVTAANLRLAIEGGPTKWLAWRGSRGTLVGSPPPPTRRRRLQRRRLLAAPARHGTLPR